MKTFLIITSAILFAIIAVLLYIYKFKILKKLNNNFSNKEIKDINVETEYYIQKLNKLEKETIEKIQNVLKTTTINITRIVMFRYGETINNNRKDDIYMMQDLLEIYLMNEFSDVVTSKIMNVYDVKITHNIEQSELSDMVEQLTHDIITVVALDSKGHKYITDTFDNFDNLLDSSTRQVYDEVRLAISTLSEIKKNHAKQTTLIRDDIKDGIMLLSRKGETNGPTNT